MVIARKAGYFLGCREETGDSQDPLSSPFCCMECSLSGWDQAGGGGSSRSDLGEILLLTGLKSDRVGEARLPEAVTGL